ncbi:MAG: hypothetical protein ACP5H5_10520 [Pyrobaculum sp.]
MAPPPVSFNYLLISGHAPWIRSLGGFKVSFQLSFDFRASSAMPPISDSSSHGFQLSFDFRLNAPGWRGERIGLNSLHSVTTSDAIASLRDMEVKYIYRD